MMDLLTQFQNFFNRRDFYNNTYFVIKQTKLFNYNWKWIYKNKMFVYQKLL